ncbi:hypothetical protein [Anaeromyxobacter terrae]|uniref:hypothetical protein n=1 Tax=Anaeromyxobacter terrae TaxID=2925406 RepID=UPI001F588882|nr:hypothetical protein [Anaeromyxobacter sp. SG22]
MVHIGELSENMTLRARDGVELGTIIRLEPAGILVESGVSFLKDHLVPIDLVSEVRDGAAYLSVTRGELRLEREGHTAIAERRVRDESSEFAHEDQGLVAPGDNVREGEAAHAEEGEGSGAPMT